MAAAEGSSSGSLSGTAKSPLPRTTPGQLTSHSPPPQSERTASPIPPSNASAYSYSSTQGSASGSASTSHRTHTPVSPQYTFGGHTPMSPQSFASGTTAGLLSTHLAVPEADELGTVLEGEREIDLGTPPTLSPEPQPQSQHPEPSGEYARAWSPDSVASAASMGGTPNSRSHQSGHSSWQFHESRAPSSAAINIAHKQRVSQAPPLPDKPYTAPPSATNRPLTPTAATSLLAAAASSLATPTMSATRLSTSTMASSIRRKSRTGAKSPLGDEDAPSVPPVPTGAMYTPSAGPSAAAELKAAIDAGAAPPHYSFLDQDPTEADKNSPPHGGVMTFSGSDRRASSASALVHGSSPHSSNSARKHLSFQSQQSEAFGYGGYGTSSSMADVGDSSGSGGGSQAGKTDRTARLSAQSFRDQWPTFAGGPAPAWGKRESNRFSLKSYKSGRSGKSRNGKRRSNGNPLDVAGRGSNETDDWVDDDEADLVALMRRAAVLERLLRHGKRASNMNANPRMVQRYSHWSIASTSLSNYGPSRVPTSRSRSGSPVKSHTPPPPRRSASSATTHTHRSKRSATSSLRHRLQRKLGMRTGGRDFQEVGSDDGGDMTEPDMTVEGIEDDSSMSIRTPQTPIRRAFSTSFSQQRVTPSPSAGVGVIVFPELAALPPLDPPRHDGEVCAQACLPPSVAVPYTPLAPPPEAKRNSRIKNKHTRTASGGSDGLLHQRSLRSLKNLRHAFDEKAGGGFSDNRASVHSATVLMGDVPTCDQRFGVRRARRLRIVAAIACLCGIILIVGLLAGLLTRRDRQ